MLQLAVIDATTKLPLPNIDYQRQPSTLHGRGFMVNKVAVLLEAVVIAVYDITAASSIRSRSGSLTEASTAPTHTTNATGHLNPSISLLLEAAL